MYILEYNSLYFYLYKHTASPTPLYYKCIYVYTVQDKTVLDNFLIINSHSFVDFLNQFSCKYFLSMRNKVSEKNDCKSCKH